MGRKQEMLNAVDCDNDGLSREEIFKFKNRTIYKGQLPLYDSDKDGIISAEEATKKRQGVSDWSHLYQFADADKNGDGVVDPDEIIFPQDGYQRFRDARADVLMKNQDDDKNDRLSFDEWDGKEGDFIIW